MATVRVAADMHLIGGVEVAMPRIVWLVYSVVMGTLAAVVSVEQSRDLLQKPVNYLVNTTK